MSLWLAVEFPQLALEVAERNALQVHPADDAQRPASKAQPKLLTEDNIVVLCNRAAHQLGVRLGSTLATALSLDGGESGRISHYKHDSAATARRLQFLAETLYRFSSQVACKPPNAVVLEVGRSLKLFGDFSALEQAVLEACSACGHQARARTARTPLAAYALAVSQAKRLADVPLQALHLQLTERHVERLDNMGIRRLGQVFKLPQHELTQRFGEAFMRFVLRVRGDLPDPQDAIHPAERFAESLHLLEPVRDKEALLFPMQRLLSELEQWLIAHQQGAELLVWRFSNFDLSEVVHMPVRFAQSTQMKRAFVQITQLKLANTELPSEVLNVHLSAARLKAWDNREQDLFRHLPPAALGLASNNGQPPSELLDQYGARLGEDAVSLLAPVDQHRPESAWAVAKQFVAGVDAPATPAGKCKRPLWLFSAPQPIDGCALKLLEGPERIQSGWWDTAVSRDYYVAEHTSGARCWAFVDHDERWFLHGYFA